MDNLAAYVATGVVSLLVGLLLRSLEPKVKIVWWRSHDFLFNLAKLNPPVVLLTQAITIQNIGRKSSESIEIVHKQPPDFFKLQPALDYEEDTTPSGEHIVRVTSLGPRESFTIEFLAYVTAPTLLFVRSKEGHAQEIRIQPQRIFPRWFIAIVRLLLLIGLGFVVYWLLRVAIFILKGVGVLP